MSMSAVKKPIETDPPRATLAPLLPLAILEAIRAQDRPHEMLEDEDVSASLPRRLGLTGVIESSIQRYEVAARRNRPVPAEEVVDLLRLVLRRPDARTVLVEAGHLAARRYFARLPSAATSALGVLPRAAARAAARRSARTLLRRLLGAGRLEWTRQPVAARAFEPLAARLDGAGTACALYGAALEELVSLYTHQRPHVTHPRCAAWGDECCEWVIGEGAEAATVEEITAET
jgi:hypothetical protein